MKKLLTATDWLLLGLGKLSDIYQDVSDPFDILRNYYENTLGIYSTKYTKQNLYQVMNYNLKTGNICKRIKDNEVYFELTNRGKEKITRKFPLINLYSKIWDHKWRFVIYDIEEKTRTIRDGLRRKLRELGFAQLQESVWITPHDFLKDIYEYLENSRLLSCVFIIETDNFFVEDLKKIAVKLWDLNTLNKEYEDIYVQLTNKNEHDRDKNSIYNLKIKIIRVLLNDPFLPEDLLPGNWWGDKARKAIKKSKVLLNSVKIC